MTRDVLLVERALPFRPNFPLLEDTLLLMSPYLPLLLHVHQDGSDSSIFHQGIFIGPGHVCVSANVNFVMVPVY